jgi:hypothetical protein
MQDARLAIGVGIERPQCETTGVFCYRNTVTLRTEHKPLKIRNASFCNRGNFTLRRGGRTGKGSDKDALTAMECDLGFMVTYEP